MEIIQSKRPLENAINLYLEYMRYLLTACIKYLNNHKTSHVCSVNFNPYKKIFVYLDNKKTKKYDAHILHYGLLKNNNEWESRIDIFTKNGFIPPFRLLQKEYLHKGFYLIEDIESIKLYRNKPENTESFWHNYGIINDESKVVDPSDVPDISINDIENNILWRFTEDYDGIGPLLMTQINPDIYLNGIMRKYKLKKIDKQKKESVLNL